MQLSIFRKHTCSQVLFRGRLGIPCFSGTHLQPYLLRDRLANEIFQGQTCGIFFWGQTCRKIFFHEQTSGTVFSLDILCPKKFLRTNSPPFLGDTLAAISRGHTLLATTFFWGQACQRDFSGGTLATNFYLGTFFGCHVF